MHYGFEWDEKKARLNEEKHGVTFDEATSCFGDVFAIESFDVDHSAAEDRFALIGMSEKKRIVVVAFTLRDGNTIRVISARQATRKERKEYEEQTP
ncbi:MAG: hypothetical protein DMF56_14060 [Acidobacteria bacterium]|nr:MAG: hypothetical protein DMF56_14060 [Acidobacteriota bacterium]